jgi:hypothetical protein
MTPCVAAPGADNLPLLQDEQERSMHLLIMIEIFAQVFFIHHAVTNQKSRFWIGILLIPWAGFLTYLIFEIILDSRETSRIEDNGAPVQVSALPSNRRLAYIAQGKLFQLSGSSPVEQIQSPFGQKIIDQTLRIHQKNEWKTEGSGSHFGGSALWGACQVDAQAIKVNITSVSRCTEGNKLYYVLESDSAGGLFVYNCDTREEIRLFHKEKFKATDLDLNRETNEFVCSRRFANGTANIALIGRDGTTLTEITQGDSIDDSPCWIPGKQRRILFQSSGIARNKDGYAVGKGSASIQALDLDNHRMTTVLEDDGYDFLQPKIGADGNLYYIRRPFEKNPYRPEVALLDFFLFPFRLIRAVFHYLNFFSLVYSRKPLTTASGPKMQGDDLKTIILKGKIIDAEKALRSGEKIMGVPSLVPSSWELIRRDENQREEIIAKNVASFDISENGTIIYSNGYGIFELNARNGRSLLLKDRLIESLIIG